MQKISFIHTADWHLGSTLNFGGKCPERIYKSFDRAIYHAFIRMVDFAIENKVNFILISGDLYDQESRSVKGNVFFNKQCERLAEYGISVYLIAGNHDPLNKYSHLFTMPDNLILFDSEKIDLKKVYDNDQLIAAISGCSYAKRADSRRLQQDFPSISGVWNIGLLHTQLDINNQNYLPVSLQNLIEKDNINYWALGHIHKKSILHSAINKGIAYPGIPQGRDMGEEGIKGFYLVELIPDMEAKINFVASSPIIFQEIEIPIDSIQDGNITDLQNLITDISLELLDKKFYLNYEEDNNIEGYIVDWVLTGRGNLYKLLKKQEEEILPYIIDELREILLNYNPFIWTRSIINRSSPLINEEGLFNSVVFQDINKITDLLKENDALKEELLEELGLIWTADFDHEQLDYFKFVLDEEKLKSILEQSRQYIIEELLHRRNLT